MPKPKETSSVKTGISSLAFSPPHCPTGMPEAHNTGKGHTCTCSNFSTTPGPILTSPNILEMLFLHNAGWSSDLYKLSATFVLTFTAPSLSAESVFMFCRIKGQTAASLFHIQTYWVQWDISQVALYCFLCNHVRLFLKEM